MQKFVAASALLAAASVSVLAQSDFLCQVTSLPSSNVACEGFATDALLADGVTWTDPIAGGKTFARIPYSGGPGDVCMKLKQSMNPSCEAVINIIASPTIGENICMKPDAKQGASAPCSLPYGSDCTQTPFQWCLTASNGSALCNSENKCEPETETMNCIATTKPSTVQACDGKVVDYPLTDGIQWTPLPGTTTPVTITYKTYTYSEKCNDLRLTGINSHLAECANVLIPSIPTQEQQKCMNESSKQGDSSFCALADNAVCTTTQVCQNFPCNSEDKCAAEPGTGETRTIDCVALRKPAETSSCSAQQAVDYTFQPGVSFSDIGAPYVVTITYTTSTSETVTCTNVGSFDTTVQSCVDDLELRIPTSGQLVCMADDATQGVNKACALPDGAECTPQEFCVNFDCNNEMKCAAQTEEPAANMPTKYAWNIEIPSGLKKEDINLYLLFPTTAVDGNPCSGLTLTFTIDAIYESQEHIFFTASDPILADCIAQIADETFSKLAASTNEQFVCHDVNTCGVETCECEKGQACEVDADGSDNCYSGLSCRTAATDSAATTTGVCNTGVLASATIALAAAIVSLLF
jgi:hypothetical protein